MEASLQIAITPNQKTPNNPVQVKENMKLHPTANTHRDNSIPKVPFS